jgi:hypothetical protein
MIKPHIKVIQRNGVDIFVTSSIQDKHIVRKHRDNQAIAGGMGIMGLGYLSLPPEPPIIIAN